MSTFLAASALYGNVSKQFGRYQHLAGATVERKENHMPPRPIARKTPAVALTPVEESHVPAVLDWFEAPHARRWWGDPRINAHELIWHRKAPSPSGCRMILADGAAVGYVQWTDLLAYFPDLPGELPAGTIDIDVLIGVAEMTGRGIGPRAIVETIDLILADGMPPLVTMFTQAGNDAAIRAYESIGFRKWEISGAPSNPSEWLMAIEPSAWARPAHL